MPDIFPDNIREAWHVRKRSTNQNGHEAVIEMANFAKLNGVEPTKEVVGAIRAQADDEWCANEPSRCTKKSRMGASSTPRAATPAEARVKVKIVAVKQVAKAPTIRRGCCGGRGAR